MKNETWKMNLAKRKIMASLALAAFGGTMQMDAAVLLSDGMNYANTTALRSVWLGLYGNGSSQTQTFYGPSPLSALNDTPASGSFLSLANQVVYRELNTQIAGDWSLSAKMLVSTYQRTLGIYLLDETGSEGYGIVWDGKSVNQLGGNGEYQIKKFDNSTHVNWSSFGNGITLGDRIPGTHPVTGYPVIATPSNDVNAATYNTAAWADFVSLRLEWSMIDGVLSLYENDVLVGQRTDTSFSNFQRVYLRGNSWGFIDDVELTGSFGASYSDWAASYPTLVGGESDDDDNDGLSNLEEFALGGNPTNASDIGYAPSYGVSGDFFEVIHVRRTLADDLLYYLEQDDNLVDAPGWIRNTDYVISGSSSFPSDPDFILVTNRISMVDKSQEFTRLGVGRNSDPFSYPLLNTNTFGATVPFITLEGENGSSNGSVVQLGTPFPWPSVPAQEASGRAYVELNTTGEYVEFTVSEPANAMVIRHCTPDAPGGGGLMASLGLYVNGVRVEDVSLSSKFNWLYITGVAHGNGQSNIPNGFPHAFWDETRLFIPGGVQAGDLIRLQKDVADIAAYYRIDLIELEEVPPPLTQPANSLSIASYGANGSSANNDTAAIEQCILDAKAQGKTVWFPAGTYLQNEYFVLDGIKVQGAGMWYTTLSDTVGNAATTWSANSGFRFVGSGSGVSDLTFNSLETTYRSNFSPKSFFGSGSNNWSVERVWVTHTGTGLWLGGDNGVVRDCRIRFTYADGINVNDGNANFLSNALVENNHVRGTGDDGIAVLAHVVSPGEVNRVTVRHNTVIAPWWASNMDMTGGTDILMHNNLLTDGAGFVVNLPIGFAMEPLNNALFSHNKILRCGRQTGQTGGLRGSIWIFPQSSGLQNFTIENNWLEDSLFHGIHVFGDKTQEITFKNNRINNSGNRAVLIQSPATGSGTFEGNISTGSGMAPVFHNASGSYTVIDDGSNVWN